MKKATMMNALIETKDGVTSFIEITGDKYDMFLQLRESGIERKPSDISKDGGRTYSRASDAESADSDADKKGTGGSYGGDDVRTIRTDRADRKRDLAALGVINLMRYVGRIFNNDIRDDDRWYRMDRKEYQKIAEKKRAHGQKMG